MNIFPLIKNFKATNITNAFIINAFSVALIASTSIQVRAYLDRLDLDKTNKWQLSETQKGLIVFITAFTVATITYTSLYLIIGFGGGMLAD